MECVPYQLVEVSGLELVGFLCAGLATEISVLGS